VREVNEPMTRKRACRAAWILALALLSRTAAAQIGPAQPLILVDQASGELEPLADPAETVGPCGQPGWAGGSGCWTARANLVLLQRTRPDSLVLFQDQSAPRQTLNAADFHFDYELGWDVSLLGSVAGLPETEIRFFSVDGWNAQASSAMLTAPIQINTAPDDGDSVDATGTVGASYDSELCSLEANVRLPHSERVTWLAGFRYLELDERFHADIPSGVTLDVATRNRLYGAQIGAEAQLWQLRRWTLEGTAKFALFGNAAAQDGVFGDGFPAERGASDDTLACAIEAGLAAVYPLTPRLSVRGAYNVLWLGNVALATDQVPVSEFVGDTGIDPHGDALYHGAFVGIEYRR